MSKLKNKLIMIGFHREITDMLIYLQRDQYCMKKRTPKRDFKILFVLVFFIILISIHSEVVFAQSSIKFTKIADVSAGNGYDILVDEGEDLCYVSFGASGMKLYDISTLSSPSLISQIPEQNNGYAHQIHQISDTIYVGDGRAGLTVYNYSVPDSLQYQNQLLGYYGWAAKSNQNTLFLASGGDLFGYDTELVLFNITQPGQLELIIEVPISQTCVDVEISGDLLLITSERIPLITFNISNVSDPIELDRAEENSVYSFATDIEIVGDYAYVANWEGPFQVFSIEDPANISLVYEDERYNDATGIKCCGDVLFLADGTEGLILFDITLRDSPEVLGVYEDGREQYRMDIVGDYVFLTQQSYGFVILLLSERNIPGFNIGILVLVSLFCVIFLYRRWKIS